MQEPEVAVYYFPNYHRDPRNEAVHGAGWTEWELVKRARPRFDGHQQPRLPLDGFEDEADPRVMAKKIDAAADHGVDAFIFDWYWYDDGPFLQRGLEEGFLRAPNNDRLKFALMWANHDWISIHPQKRADRLNKPNLLYPGAVTPKTFEAIMDHCLEHYFSHGSYWLRGGCPYFSIYALDRLIAGLGGIEKTRVLLDKFREKVKAAGFPDLHLNAILYETSILAGESMPRNALKLVEELGFNSVGSYVWIHHYQADCFPQVEYEAIRDAYFECWNDIAQKSALPYYPNVTMGWDSSPRTVQSDVFDDLGYPFMYSIANNSPAAFRKALELTKKRLGEQEVPHPFLTINAWNEWTEGSYLEPDQVHGLAYLNAVREVFPGKSKEAGRTASSNRLDAVR